MSITNAGRVKTTNNRMTAWLSTTLNNINYELHVIVSYMLT